MFWYLEIYSLERPSSLKKKKNWGLNKTQILMKREGREESF